METLDAYIVLPYLLYYSLCQSQIFSTTLIRTCTLLDGVAASVNDKWRG